MRRRTVDDDSGAPLWVRRFDPDEWRIGLVVRDLWPNAELAEDYEAWHRWVAACHEYREVHGGPFVPGSDEAEDRLWWAIGSATMRAER